MKKLLSAEEMQAKLREMARAVAAVAPSDGPLAVVGIRRRGEYLAQRLARLLAERGLRPAHQGALDITLYRDDLTTIGPKAVVRSTDIGFDVTGTWLLLVDDVLYTGRSVRAALDALTDLGRPRAIRLAVLVDRGRRELPIQPDFVGLHLETTPANVVKVKVREVDGEDGVDLS